MSKPVRYHRQILLHFARETVVSVRIGGLMERVGAGRVVGGALILVALVGVGGRAAGLFDSYSVGRVGSSEESAVAVDSVANSIETSRSPLGGGVGQFPGATASGVVVHVAGAVLRPGVYALPGGARVVDAVEAAGGQTSEADQSAVNLASQLTDGAQVYIPTVSEVAGGWSPSSTTSNSESGPMAGGAGPSTTGGPVDINTAGVAELDTLPGIGQVTAGKIVADRTANGPFRSIDDLGRISGIGDAKIGALEGLAVAR